MIMAQIDFKSLTDTILGTLKNSLGDKWQAIGSLATTSAKTLAHNLVEIEKMMVNKKITPEQAKLLFNMQKNALTTVLLSEEGLGLLAAEAAINDVLDAIKGIANKALGFALI